MIPREASEWLEELAKGYPILAITGPRQAGKTTLAKYVFKKKQYVSLENPDMLDHARNDPRAFLERYREGAIFDEAQRCTTLFSYLQGIVDEDNKPGQFILTGSQQFGLMSSITQSLAGRVALLHLLPFTFKECYTGKKASTLPTLDDLLFTGLYPPIYDRQLDPQRWYANYMQTYIERDVRQLLNVTDLSTFQRFVRLCAGRTGQLINFSDLGNDTGISHNTAKAWLSILEASYLIRLLQPHHRNFNKRIIKTPKLYFYDTGLACWLLGIGSSEQLGIHSMRGALFENWVIAEMIKQRFNRGLPDALYFWRDRSGNEIDLLVEEGEQLIPIEIKSGKTLHRSFLQGLKKWTHLAGSSAKTPTLIYGGDLSTVYEDVQVHAWHDTAWMK